uniref:Uncharacterized protein n=1 Tax=Rhizophora mucronata TaxID=61149 RepID=A0A2P2QTD3_RHIMU
MLELGLGIPGYALRCLYNVLLKNWKELRCHNKDCKMYCCCSSIMNLFQVNLQFNLGCICCRCGINSKASSHVSQV